MGNVDELEAFIDESILRSRKRGYYPSEFIRMRGRDKSRTVDAIERLIKAGEIQSGFKRLQQLDLLEWSIEASVLKFPDQFTAEAIACADFRLRNINDPVLRTR